MVFCCYDDDDGFLPCREVEGPQKQRPEKLAYFFNQKTFFFSRLNFNYMLTVIIHNASFSKGTKEHNRVGF